MSTITTNHKLISTAGGKSCQSLHLPKLIQSHPGHISVNVKHTHISTNQNQHHHHHHHEQQQQRQQHHQRHRQKNPLEKIKKPRTFGLYLITMTNQQRKASKLHVSLNYKVLYQHRRHLIFPNTLSSSSSSTSIHCQLLPISYLKNDNSVRDQQQFPREITTDRLHALLLLPSPQQVKLTQVSSPTESTTKKWISSQRKQLMKSSELQIFNDKYHQCERIRDQMKLSTNLKPFLSSSPLNGINYQGSRLKFFYDSIYQCNFPAIKYILDRQLNLAFKAIEPTSGYSILLIALLYIQSPVKRIKLIKLLLKYLTKYLSMFLNDVEVSENDVCERVLQAIDPIHGRDCIAWSCVLGYTKEFHLLFTHLLTSINLQKSDYYGDTYLHLAVIGGSLDIISHLCQYINKYCIPIDKCMNLSGYNPIHLAAKLKFDAALDLLKQYQINKTKC